MSKLPNLKPREIVTILLHAGFIEHTTHSTHRTYKHPGKKLYTTVSFHTRTIPQGTLRAIIRQAGMTTDEFLSYRKKKK